MVFRPERQKFFFLPLIYFSLGAFTLVQQTILLREIFVVVSGNEFSFGITLANWLAGVFFGSTAGGIVADRIRRIGPAFAATVWLLCLTSPVMISLARLIHILNSTPSGTSLSFLRVFFYSALATIPFSFLVGFAFPLAARIGPKMDVPPSDRISRMYMTEAIGALAGGTIYTFLLVERLDSFSIVALFALPLLSLVLIPLLHHTSSLTRGIGIALIFLNILAIALRLPGRWNDRLVQKRWQSISPLTLIEARDTRVQNLQLGEAYGQFSLFGNGQLSTVFPDDDQNRVLAAHLICQHPSPKRILVIGEAVSGLGSWLLRYPVEKVESVEIDPVLLDIIRKNLNEENRRILEDRRFRLVIRDGREYVRAMAGRIHRGDSAPRWDLVFIHTAEPSTALLNRYYTREFFSDISTILRDEGVLALRVTASENYSSGIVGTYSSSIYQTLKTAFPCVAVSPGTSDTFFASGSQTSVSTSSDTLARRYRQTGMEPAAMGDIFRSLYPPEKTRAAISALEGQSTVINGDEKPIAFFYYNKILGWYSGSSGGRLLEFFERRNTGEVILFLVAVTVILLAAARVRVLPPITFRRIALLYAAAAAGFSGLALEMTVIYFYQVRLGYAYRTVGMLIALFMLGLAVGARLSSAWLDDSRNGGKGPFRLLMADQLLTGAVAVGYPFFLRLFPGQRMLWSFAIPASMILVGLLVGVSFPLAVEGLLRTGAKGGRTAGSVNALDHLGAALGAFLTAALFLPVLGIVGNGLITGAMAFSSALLLAAGFGSK